jgi:hypothetical protein
MLGRIERHMGGIPPSQTAQVTVVHIEWLFLATGRYRKGLTARPNGRRLVERWPRAGSIRGILRMARNLAGK